MATKPKGMATLRDTTTARDSSVLTGAGFLFAYRFKNGSVRRVYGEGCFSLEASENPRTVRATTTQASDAATREVQRAGRGRASAFDKNPPVQPNF